MSRAVAPAASVEELRAAYERAEQRRQEAAEVERREFEAWQETYGAHEVARDEAEAAYQAYVSALPASVEVPA